MERSPYIQESPSFDARQFRIALGRFATGVTVLTAEFNGHVHGMTANSFMSVSLDPPLIVVSIDNRAHMKQVLQAGHNLGVSVLSEEQEALSNHFAGRPIEGMEIQFVRPTDTPLLEGALAHLVARIVAMHPAGDHTLYVGQVEYIAWQDSRPLVFYGGKYHHLMPGQTSNLVDKGTWAEDDLSLFSMGRFDHSARRDAKANGD